MPNNDFRKLWTASAVSNLGDGVTMVAGPLLVADLTGDPGLVAGSAFVQQLPWLLFALVSGAYVDRLDRRRIVVAVNAGRAAVLAGLTLTVATGTVSIPLIYLAFFLLGVGETLADSAYGALLPNLVPDEHLERANARLMATFVVGNQLVAKPLGAYLFVVGAAIPFGFDATTFLVAALCLAAVRWRPPARQPAPPTTLRADVVEGLRALWARPPLRLLAGTLSVMNLLFCAAFAAFVLYAERRLGLGPVGYGVLLSVWAVGGLLGTAVVGRLTDRFRPGVLLRAGLVVEVLTHLTLALTTSPYVAAPVLVLFGVHTMVWGAAVGTLLGGLLAGVTSLTAPYWAAAVGLVALTAVVWRRFGRLDRGERLVQDVQPAT